VVSTDSVLAIGGVPPGDYAAARRLVASAFAREPFAFGMFGDSALARFAGMVHHYETWPDAPNPLVLGASTGGHLVGVAFATLPGECGLCDAQLPALDADVDNADRIEYEFQLASQRAHGANDLGRHARIETVVTEPTLHGFGIGRVLMAAMIDDLRARKVECVVLECLTTRTEFYEHFGFRSVDEFDDPSGPGLRMVLMKSQHAPGDSNPEPAH
jgi:GNAT superfamily N-acetyltransferase